MALLLACSGSAAVSAAEQLATVVVERARVARETTFEGVVEAVNRSTVAAQTTGRVLELPYDVGDYVEKDALIARFTEAEQRARAKSLEGAVAEAEARLTEAKLAYERTRDVYEKKLIARADLDGRIAAAASGPCEAPGATETTATGSATTHVCAPALSGSAE